MRVIAAFALFLTLVAGAWSPAGAAAEPAERRVALVVGNGDYRQVPALANPRNDAEAMAAALRRLGFDVELGVDLDLQGMRRVVQAFSRKLEGSDVALFFYAGHGMQVYGQNYLLPVDASLETEADLDFSAVPARLVLGQMERWPGVKIVMLDACRDNPFASTLTRSMGASRAARALSRGLAPIETAGGTLLAYATDPGDVAADGEGRHSPFTAALLKHVEEPGVEINTMLARVRAEVYTSTGRRQRPWTETSLIGEFYMAPEPEPAPVQQVMMAPEPAPPPPSSGMDPRTIELALWGAAQAGGTAADYEEYLRQYPDGIFAGIARNRIAVLEAEASPRASGTTEADPPADAPGAPAAGPGAAVAADAVPAPAGERGNAGAAGGDVAAGSPGDGGIGATAPTPAPAPAETLAMLPQTGQHAPAPPVPGTPEPGPDPAAREAALGLGQEERRAVQARLMLAGHDPRGVDGIFGPGTRAALAAWQGAQGLVATGYLDDETLARLERATEAEYAAWVERQRAEAEHAAAARARAAETAAARAAAQPTAVRSTPTAPAPADAPPPISTLAPMPTAPVAAPPPTTTTTTTAPPAAAETREQECYHVWTGSTTLERRCKDAPTGAARLGRRK